MVLVSADDMASMASRSDPQLLKHIYEILAKDVPEESERFYNECFISCQALQNFAVYLIPKQRYQMIYTSFPRIGPRRTWGHIWRWAQELEKRATPLEDEDSGRPRGCLGDDWYGPVTASFLEVILSLLDFHPKSRIVEELRKCDGLPKFLVKALLGSMSLAVPLDTVGSIIFHSCYGAQFLEGDMFPAAVAAVLKTNRRIDFARAAVESFQRLQHRSLNDRTVRSVQAALLVIDTLYDGSSEDFVGMHLARWCSVCIVRLAKASPSFCQLDLLMRPPVAAASVLKYTFKLLAAIFRREGSVGWVYESLRAGLISAFGGLKPLLCAERSMACLASIESVGPAIVTLWEELLDALTPHLLCTQVLQLAKSALGKDLCIHDGFQPRWNQWTVIVSTTFEVYSEYKRLDNSWTLARVCANDKCDGAVLSNAQIGDKKIPSFKACKGCLQVTYCSRDCQRIDWKAAAGHRQVCETSRAALKKNSRYLIRMNVGFIRYLVQSILQRSHKDVEKLGARLQGNRVLVLDFGHGFGELKVLNEGDLKTDAYFFSEETPGDRPDSRSVVVVCPVQSLVVRMGINLVMAPSGD
ncbi:hypothetical protein VNI00_016458 [Paramarasmius palmivorus]|uniref:MYND-type domain-containing protein n=1 Tax=Paramarasmius palmivorus TaxID=297713 RepID=A0AAW0BES4_9AGAR